MFPLSIFTPHCRKTFLDECAFSHSFIQLQQEKNKINQGTVLQILKLDQPDFASLWQILLITYFPFIMCVHAAAGYSSESPWPVQGTAVHSCGKDGVCYLRHNTSSICKSTDDKLNSTLPLLISWSSACADVPWLLIIRVRSQGTRCKTLSAEQLIEWIMQWWKERFFSSTVLST